MGDEFISFMFEGHEEPTAKWMLATDLDRHQVYIVHLGRPSFIAKISDARDVGLRSGTSFGMRDGRNLYDFIFYGTAPATESELAPLLHDAESAIIAASGHAV